MTERTKKITAEIKFISMQTGGFTMIIMLTKSSNTFLVFASKLASLIKFVNIIWFIESEKFQNGSKVNTYLKILKVVPY